MKRFFSLTILLAVTFAFSLPLHAQFGPWHWATNEGSDLNEQMFDIVAVPSGNLYATGTFSSATFSLQQVTLSNSGQYSEDIFIAKYDDAKNIVWAKSFGNTGVEAPTALFVDNESEYIYLTGYFSSSSITFGTETLTNTGDTDIFIVKISPSGDVVWAQHIGGSNAEMVRGITADNNGAVYVAGSFNSLALNAGNLTLDNSSVVDTHKDLFLVKYDSNGNPVFAKQSTGDYSEIVYDLISDQNNNIYLAGTFSGDSFLFENQEITNFTYYKNDMFLIKLNADGEWIMGTGFGGDADDYLFSLAVDNEENIYIRGPFDSQELTIGEFTIDNPNCNCGQFEMLLAKLDANGTPLWAQKTGGWLRPMHGSMVLSDMAVDERQNVFVAGTFDSEKLLIGDSIFFKNGAYSVYLAEYNADGEAIWANSATGSVGDAISCLTLDNNRNIYAGGMMLSPELDFGTTVLTTQGNEDALLAYIQGFNIDLNDIQSFSADALENVVIDTENHTVSATTEGDITGITPTIIVDDGARIWPENGVEQDFSAPVVYTVTSKDGTTQEWMVNITQSSSNITELNRNENWVIYPNPANETIHCRLPAEIEGEAGIRLYNAQGQVLRSIETNGSESIYNFDLQNFSSGLYFISVTHNGISRTQQFVVQ